ncbi:MAG: ABC transporter permease [Acidobacteriia bacterium]|nr:ABC transporter permease [Terriglobia bacterium]
MGTLFKDIRYGVRMLLRSPGFTVVTVLVIALGLGARSGIFSLFHSVPPPSIPSRDSSGLAIVWKYPEWKSRNRVFGDLAAVVEITTVNLTGTGEPEELLAGAVSANFFQRIGVHTILGRAFAPDEDQRGRDHVVILSHRLWIRRFGSDAGIVGKNIVLNGESRQVIGILPPDFAWNNRRTDVWLPYAMDPDRDYRAASGGYLKATGQRKPGATLPEA